MSGALFTIKALVRKHIRILLLLLECFAVNAALAPSEPKASLEYPNILLISGHSDTDHLDDGEVPEAFYTTNARRPLYVLM